MKIILGFILLHAARSLPPPNPHLFEMIQSVGLRSQISSDDDYVLSQELVSMPKTRTACNIVLDFTRRIFKSTTEFRLPKRTRKRFNKTAPTTPSTMPPTLPTVPVSYSFPHTIFDVFFEKQNLIAEVSRYFNFTRIPQELQPFYIWYYNVLHDSDAAERRKRVLDSRISYSPAKHLREEILDHTVFQVPFEHQEYYVLVNDLAADTKDPTVLTFPKGVTFYKYSKTTPMEQVLDELLYDDRSVKSSQREDVTEDGPNIFYTTHPSENTTTVITTTTPEPEPFDKLIDYNNLYKDEASWMTTDVDTYEAALEYLEKYKEKNPIPPGEDDRTYFF